MFVMVRRIMAHYSLLHCHSGATATEEQAAVMHNQHCIIIKNVY